MVQVASPLCFFFAFFGFLLAIIDYVLYNCVLTVGSLHSVTTGIGRVCWISTDIGSTGWRDRDGSKCEDDNSNNNNNHHVTTLILGFWRELATNCLSIAAA